MVIKRGDIFYADLRPVVGSEQGGIRPVLIIQNNVGNRHSPTVICAAITSKMNKAKLPTHIEINAELYGIEKDSVILLEQLRTIDKRRLKDKVCHLDDAMLDKVNQLGIGPGGLGGTVTAFAVNIETYPTHIAGLPVAVNICCHVNRHVTKEL
mgnify:CR=1 FL=1